MSKKQLCMAVAALFLAGCAGPYQSGVYSPPASAANSPMALAGCPNVPDRPINRNKQVIGSAIGAVAGGVVGKAVSKQTAGTIVGAGLGGLFGYLVGTQIAVKEQADGSVLLDIPGAALFDTDQTNIKPSFADTLSQIAGTLKQNPGTIACVIGYTDSRGSTQYNQTLSVRRAQSVTSFLVNRSVDPSRLAARGMGESMPVASNETASGRAQNRRVEMYVRR